MVDLSDYAKNKTQLSKRINVHRVVLDEHITDPGFPKKTRLGYPVSECLAWWDKSGLPHIVKSRGNQELAEVKYENLKLDAHLKRLRIDEIKRRVLTLDEHCSVLVRLGSIFSSVIGGIPSQVALLTTDAVVVSRIESLCDHASLEIRGLISEERKRAAELSDAENGDCTVS